MSAEMQSLTHEDQLIILAHAALYLTATRGMGAEEARVCYERMESLCRSVDRPQHLYVALMGQWRYSLTTDKLTASIKIAQRVYSLAKEQNEPALMVEPVQLWQSRSILWAISRPRDNTRFAALRSGALEPQSLPLKGSTPPPSRV